MSKHRPLITTAGDLEVVLLYETHSLLAELISEEYYALLGEPPSEVRFHTSSAFRNFYVHVYELIALGPNVAVGDMKQSSLADGVKWFCSVHPEEAHDTGLDSACVRLDDWFREEREVTFWCWDVGAHVTFRMKRADVVRFAANFAKHGLLRLPTLMEQLRRFAAASGLDLYGTEVVALRESFLREIESRLLYLSSWLVELMGELWSAINAVVVRRSQSGGTNDVRLMRMPEGVTSDALRNLYGSTLVFKRYDAGRITKYVPRVPDLLKTRY